MQSILVSSCYSRFEFESVPHPSTDALLVLDYHQCEYIYNVHKKPGFQILRGWTLKVVGMVICK